MMFFGLHRQKLWLLFAGGLLLRLLLIVGVTPAPVADWYAPFLEHSLNGPWFDPWAGWLADGGTAQAFPYGYVMWLVFLPLTGVCKLLGVAVSLGYGLTQLVADLLLLQLLRRLFPGRDAQVLGYYWLSPIVILAAYLFGYNDLIPVALLVWASWSMQQLRFQQAGLICAAAMSAKLSMLIALPFFLIYLLRQKSLSRFLPRFGVGLGVGGVLWLLPFVASSAALGMLLGNPELGKVYRLSVALDERTHLYLLPCAYLLMLYAAWRIRRQTFDLFQALMGLAFMLFVLLTPASPGWFVWLMPILVGYQIAGDRTAVLLTSAFALFYLLGALWGVAYTSEAALLALHWPGGAPVGIGGRLGGLLQTAMVTTGVILAVRIWRQRVRDSDAFRFSRKPLVIGVAGDSGAGKDAFALSVQDLFGGHSVSLVSGDDYHRWDRQKPIWQVMTHLHPQANDLERFASDVLALIHGQRIHSRHYDHETGRLSRPRVQQGNDLIVASGLHALYLPLLRGCYDLSVYLDISEDLRRHFKLQRDVEIRGHSREKVLTSFTRREPDAQRFIRPQAEHADLVLSLQPMHPRALLDIQPGRPLRFKLQARSVQGFNDQSLFRVLVGVCGLHVDVESGEGGTLLTIEGDASAEDMALAARLLLPEFLEFLDAEPRWHDGMTGVMQLITLLHINQALVKRVIQ